MLQMFYIFNAFKFNNTRKHVVNYIIRMACSLVFTNDGI